MPSAPSSCAGHQHLKFRLGPVGPEQSEGVSRDGNGTSGDARNQARSSNSRFNCQIARESQRPASRFDWVPGHSVLLKKENYLIMIYLSSTIMKRPDTTSPVRASLCLLALSGHDRDSRDLD